MLVQECLTNFAQLVPFYAINNEISCRLRTKWEQADWITWRNITNKRQ